MCFKKRKIKATIKTFPCIDGDCIFMKLYDQSNTDSFHIMIDCGALSENIIDFICHDLNLKIDLLIVTHIDKMIAYGYTTPVRYQWFNYFLIRRYISRTHNTNDETPTINNKSIVPEGLNFQSSV